VDTAELTLYTVVMDVQSVEAKCEECAVRGQLSELHGQLTARVAEVAELKGQVEALKRKVAGMAEIAFRHSERQHAEPSEVAPEPAGACDMGRTAPVRGQRPGRPGHGRRLHPDLPTVDVDHELPPEELFCPHCHAPYIEIPGEQTSEEIEFEVVVRRKVHHRKRYHATCNCADTPALKVAPPPPKVIPKGQLSAPALAMLLVLKFDLAMPLQRILSMLSYQGLSLSKGSVTGTFQTLPPLFLPVYEALCQRVQAAQHWHIDETRWLVFLDEQRRQWWLWVFASEGATCFVIDRTRSAKALHRLLPDKGQGQIVSSDRYVVYAGLTQLGYLIQYCWAHLRRDFIRAARGDAALRPWANAWLKRIRTVYRLREAREEAFHQYGIDSADYQEKDKALRDWVRGIRRTLTAQLQEAPNVRALNVLLSFDERWEHYITFLDYPTLPIDNNAAERALRREVLGRKNYYGSRAEWSVQLAEALFSIYATLHQNGLNPFAWTRDFLSAVAHNGGAPLADVSRFLPWGMSDHDREVWRMPTRERRDSAHSAQTKPTAEDTG
jgi:transposase